MNKVIFWDFHDTLVYSPVFRSSLNFVLEEYGEERQISDENRAQWLKGCFPWHEPDKDYRHLREPEAWWNNVCKTFERAFVMNGIAPEKACIYAKEARKYIIAPEHYSLFEDTLETLQVTREKGYRNIILSNHIPELPQIVECMGLMEYVEICITSANVGFEKPNPQIFAYAMELAGNPQEVWMVGDNINADIRGAEAAGIRAILVRKPTSEPVRYFSPDLKGVLDFIDK